jgi:hypothetical protein
LFSAPSFRWAGEEEKEEWGEVEGWG